MGIEVDGANQKLILDSDGDTYLEAASDDTIKVYVSGAHDATISANAINILSGTTLTIDSGATITNSGTANGFSSADPSSADGDSLGTASLEWSDLFLADGGTIQFGNDQEVRLIHTADTGLILKHTATADDKPISLTLQTGETDIAQDDVIGKIDFQAPDEGTGTDAILVAAGIEAVSEGDFSSSNNATKLSFKTAASEAAAEKMSLSSAGLLTVTGGITMTGTTPTLTIGDAGAEDTKIVFDGNAQDFHIGLDDTDDDFKIGLGSTLGTTAHIVIDEAGCVTKPLQPAFLAVSSSNNISNVATDASDVTVPFPSEVFDNNADYNTSTYKFTAPVTGRYQFNCNLMVSDMDAAATYVRLRLVASNRNIDIDVFEPNLSADASRWTLKCGALVDMDASDTVHMTLAQYEGTSQMDSDSSNSTFSGYLVC